MVFVLFISNTVMAVVPDSNRIPSYIYSANNFSNRIFHKILSYLQYIIQILHFQYIKFNITEIKCRQQISVVFHCVCFSIFLYRLSIQIAPRGAVIRIETTATVNTMFPQSSPIAKGIVPIAA